MNRLPESGEEIPDRVWHAACDTCLEAVEDMKGRIEAGARGDKLRAVLLGNLAAAVSMALLIGEELALAKVQIKELKSELERRGGGKRNGDG